jgi:cell wall assembly regulator SMI1
MLAILSASGYAQKDTTAQRMISEVSKPPVDSNILIVINGAVAGTIRELKKDINKMFPADIIESMEVLKGFRATDKYGEKGKAGVIEFYLKNVKITDAIITRQNVYEDSVFRKVEIEASFPGGDRIWRSYLERNLNANVPVDNKAPEGTYTVIVQFIVDKNGEISDINALTNHGYGMEQEVIKVISKGPKWSPAIQDGKPVKAYRKQPVTFSVVADYAFRLSTRIITAGKPTLVEITDMDYVKDDEIEVTVSYGTITHDSGKKYIITVDKPGKIYLIVRKKAKKKKDEYEYGTEAIEVK